MLFRSEAFLGVDAILNIMINVTSGLVVYPEMVRQRVMRELPFMATENIMMSAVKKGGDRQELHEKIRQYSIEAGKQVKEKGLENDLCERILADDSFKITKEELDEILKPESFTGRSEEQVLEYIEKHIKPIMDANKDILNEKVEMKN